MQDGQSLTPTSGLRIAFLGVEKKGWYDVDRYQISIAGLLSVQLRLRVAHPLLQTPGDAETHFNVLVDSIVPTENVHGVLGQTYRQGRTAKALQFKMLAEMLGHPVAADGKSGLGYLDGKTEDYVSSDILSADCKYSSFVDNDATA